MSITDKDLENRIRDTSFSNSEHKSRLKKKLFDSSAELSLDDLVGVAGGVGLDSSSSEEDKWEPWPTDVFYANKEKPQ